MFFILFTKLDFKLIGALEKELGTGGTVFIYLPSFLGPAKLIREPCCPSIELFYLPHN